MAERIDRLDLVVSFLQNKLKVYDDEILKLQKKIEHLDYSDRIVIAEQMFLHDYIMKMRKAKK